MQPASDPEVMRVLESQGIEYDGITGLYTMEGNQDFFFDFKSHTFTTENASPETSFPVMSSERYFGEELMAILS